MGQGCTKLSNTITCKNSNCCSNNNLEIIETNTNKAHDRLDDAQKQIDTIYKDVEEILKISQGMQTSFFEHRKSYKDVLHSISTSDSFLLESPK